MNSKKIGNITEVECMLAFMKLEYNVLQPYGDCERYDFVADINGKFYKIQCKTSQIIDDGSAIQFSCRSSHRVEGKCVNVKYSSEDTDFFATVYKEQCYLIPQKECKTMKRLRFTPPNNGQIKDISFAEDYKLETIIATL